MEDANVQERSCDPAGDIQAVPGGARPLEDEDVQEIQLSGKATR